MPRTFLANNRHRSDLKPERPPGLPDLEPPGEDTSVTSPSLRLPPFSALSAALLIGDECRLDDTEETLRLSPAADECLRLKKAKAMDEDLSRPLPAPPLAEDLGPFRLFEDAMIISSCPLEAAMKQMGPGASIHNTTLILGQ